MPETPKKVRARVDDVIHELNANWDLQLPRLHGRDAEAAEDTSLVARRCSARLNYLSFRVDSFDGVLKDFDSDARKLYSKWTMKPAQEKGTLPVLPVTKSFLHRDITRKRVIGLNRLTKEQRDKLLELLDNTLKDDFNLARTSDSYERTSQASRAPSRADSATPSRRHSPRLAKSTSRLHQTPQQDAASIALPATGPAVQQSTQMTRKRGSGEVTRDQSKRQRSEDSKRSRSEACKQTKLDFGRQPATGSIPPPPPAAQSFNTASSSPSDGFDSEPRSNTSSAATSILEPEQSTDYFPTQNDAGLWGNPVEGEATSSVAVSFSAEDISQKLQSTFEDYSSRLPAILPFEYLYELQSLSYSWDLNPLDMFKKIEKLCKCTVPSADARWEAFKKIRPSGARLAQEVFGRAWTPADGKSTATDNRSIYLSAALEWTKASDSRIFKVRLSGPTTDKSCRFHRVYGGDRFLVLQIPFIDHGDLPSHLQNHKKRLHEDVVRWLSSSEHTIGGRQWRAFWVDDSPPKATKTRPSFNKVYLFAVSGVGLKESPPSQRPLRSPMTIEQFINHHAPITHNIKFTNLKLFARFKLGLSKTIPTVVLEKKHFRVVHDKTGSDGKTVMNDGCGLMSPALARDIARQLGLTETPSAFQGRISGAKGLWIVDYSSIQHAGSEDRWIQITPSQLKVLPHPATRDTCDEYRQFEVSGWSQAPQQSSLNTQFLTVLADRRVPPKVLEKCLREHIDQYFYTDLCNAMVDPRYLRSWIQQYHRTARNNDEVDSSGAFPRDRSEKLNMMLDAGFDPQERCSLVRDLVSSCLNDYLNWWAEKLRITINESTFLYCVPDPYDILGEGEVYCGLSQGWTDPKTGVFSLYAAGMDGLVSRNPANHPTDIQRVRLVFRPELQNFRDVMIFSTKGQRPLASLLSGGDYDGDQCWLCWRQDIVASFQNYDQGPPEHITPQSCGLKERAERLTTMVSDCFDADAATVFLSGCLDFNLKFPMVGRCTVEHETVVYHRSLQDDGAIRLAALAAFLVDARKQGLELTEDAWSKLQVECRGPIRLSRPAYKDAATNTNYKESNIIDRLRFKVAKAMVTRAQEDFHKRWPPAERGLEYDAYFATTWVTAWTRAGKNERTLSILRKLKEDVQEVVKLWQQLILEGRADDNPGNHPQFVATCFERFAKIEPHRTTDEDDIHRRYDDERGRRFSYWNILRASCFYRSFHTRTLTWYMIGEELCFLQAERSGRMRSIAGPMYAVTKIDGRAVRSRMASNTVEDISFTGPIAQYFESRA